MRNALIMALLALVAACSRAPVPVGTTCATDHFSVDDDFPGARRGDCHILDSAAVRLDIRPEDANVTNRSPWFAFRLTPQEPGVATITLDYGEFEHRYVPKLSTDGRSWQPIEDVALSDEGQQATFEVRLGDEPVFVTAQELLMPEYYESWLGELDRSTAGTVAVAGESVEGRPIPWLIFDGPSDDVVLLTGRQHPPEVSGSIAMVSFVDTLASDSELAREFRQRFDLVVMPLLNPDGVVHGHWRHGLGGLDLNRDWGEFGQPETRIVVDFLETLERDGRALQYFLDFHSTDRNLFYTFPDEMLDDPDFLKTWFSGRRSACRSIPSPTRTRDRQPRGSARTTSMRDTVSLRPPTKSVTRPIVTSQGTPRPYLPKNLCAWRWRDNCAPLVSSFC